MICERELELEDLSLVTCITEEGIAIQHDPLLPLFCDHGNFIVTYQECAKCEREYRRAA